MKAELAALCVFKTTTTPAATTGAGKRALTEQDKLPKLRVSGELHAPPATSNSGEKVRELSVSKPKIANVRAVSAAVNDRAVFRAKVVNA